MGHPEMMCQLMQHRSTYFALQPFFIRTAKRFERWLKDRNDVSGILGPEPFCLVKPVVSSEYQMTLRYPHPLLVFLRRPIRADDNRDVLPLFVKFLWNLVQGFRHNFLEFLL